MARILQPFARMDRRDFFGRLGLGTAALGLSPTLWPQASTPPSGTRPALPPVSPVAPDDESYWSAIRQCFAPTEDFVSFEYGYFCPAALPTLERSLAGARTINAQASHYMRTERTDDVEAARRALARIGRCDPEEIAITRNTTESMNIILNGLDLQPGDEIVYSDQDYGSMVQAMKQKAGRYGIVLREVAIPLHPESDEAVVEAFAAGLTPRTRLLHVTQMINLTGHVLPVRKICAMAHARGVEVAVDAAHAFAHVSEDLPALGCDYLGTSLHKWLCAPVGLGLLYVRREKIPSLWPLMGNVAADAADIRKFERQGTRPYNHHMALLDAIELHETIGFANKRARLRHLQSTWLDGVRDLPRAIVNTPADPARHGAIANFALDGMEPKELSERLFKEFAIFTVPIQGHPVVHGVRITPGLPTSARHLEQIVDAIRKIAAT